MKRVQEQVHLFWLRAGVIKELFGFLFTHKLWWAVPIIFVTVILIVIFLFGQHTGAAPFIYPLF